jgi:hypothetical protein
MKYYLLSVRMKELGLNRFGCFPAKGAGFCYYDTKGHPELKDIAHIGFG